MQAGYGTQFQIASAGVDNANSIMPFANASGQADATVGVTTPATSTQVQAYPFASTEFEKAQYQRKLYQRRAMVIGAIIGALLFALYLFTRDSKTGF